MFKNSISFFVVVPLVRSKVRRKYSFHVLDISDSKLCRFATMSKMKEALLEATDSCVGVRGHRPQTHMHLMLASHLVLSRFLD
ncbi:MAG: hypothetical protein AAF639_24585 [Chloroflexota bacterium]